MIATTLSQRTLELSKFAMKEMLLPCQHIRAHSIMTTLSWNRLIRAKDPQSDGV